MSKSKKRLLAIAIIAVIGIIVLLAALFLYYFCRPDSKRILAYMERTYKKDFQIIDEFTYISYTDGEPDTRQELECPAVVLQDKENDQIRCIAYAYPFGDDWLYRDNYARKLLIYCINQEQIEMNNKDECEADDSFAYPCLVLDHTDETAQKLQNMTIRYNELYQYNNRNNYNEHFQVEGSMYLYSVEAGNISDQWLDETSPFCYDTPLEKYQAFLNE